VNPKAISPEFKSMYNNAMDKELTKKIEIVLACFPI
jgi:hypothetical protein